MKAINGEELKNRLDAGENLVVVEAFSEEHYRSGHIPGGRHLPLEHLDRRAGSVIRDSHAPVIVYCASEACQNSHTAAKHLTELGYSDVSVYTGGKADWKQRGYCLEKPA
jgi:rhodanese-related sulfurtransferase